MPLSLTGVFRAQACNNAWSNHRLLKACGVLDTAALAAPRSGFFASLIATLNHILIIDLFYVDALEGGWLGPAAWANPVPHPYLPGLVAAQRAMDQRLIRHCEVLDETSLAAIVRINRDSRVQEERRDRLLLHLFQHQIHHRGQAHAMLSDAGVKPPQLDEFYSACEAPLRAGDLDEMGLSEAAIWGEA